MNYLSVAVSAAFMMILGINTVYASSVKFNCDFPIYHASDEEKIQPSNDFSLQFSMDTITGDAFIEGNLGLNPVLVHIGYGGITFLEALETGAVQTTTIASNGFAVHSRHSLIGSELVPSQYYGKCLKI